MRSLVDVTFGEAEAVTYGVIIPVGVTMSEDDTDGDSLPSLEFTWFKTYVTHQNVQKGMEVVKAKVTEMLREQFRFNYGPLTYPRLESRMLEHLDTIDLTPLSAHWFNDPESQTKH